MAKITVTEHDFELLFQTRVVDAVMSHVDRMGDICPEDPADQIIESFLAKFNPLFDEYMESRSRQALIDGEIEAKVINMADVDIDRKLFVGYELGQQYREMLRLDRWEDINRRIHIVVPSDTYGITHSFFRGFLQQSHEKLPVGMFKLKYTLEGTKDAVEDFNYWVSHEDQRRFMFSN